MDVIDLLWFGNHLPDGVKVIQKDLFTCTREDIEGYDQVIFLAGLSNDPMAEFSPSKNFVDKWRAALLSGVHVKALRGETLYLRLLLLGLRLYGGQTL